MKYQVKFTSRFKKDIKVATKQGKNLEKMYEVIDMLASGQALDASYKDHALTGEFEGSRECHIESDWLLVYALYNDVMVLSLMRLGSHSELF
ncbi:MAG: type II toxin-antitoxin system YafQ family toxin [Phascolarctobacterium sp.]|nr:type II toxin-antitoxin system YafQ family toxin [Phascolarctobacterium sp.]